MPSFFILDWSVVRFMPRRAAQEERALMSQLEAADLLGDGARERPSLVAK